MSYLTKDQLENYLNKLPGTNKPKEYQQTKNDLTYPASVQDRMNRLRLSTGTKIPTTDVRTPILPEIKPEIKRSEQLPETPKPTAKVNTPSPLYVGQECVECHEQVSGSVVSALGGLWHTRCFRCKRCHRELENEQYYEKDNQIYCAKDYRQLFSIICHACHEPIEHQALRVLGKYYHENHFCCCVCKLPIGQEQFKVHEEEAYCQEDYLKKFGKRCSGCSQFLQGEYINALGQMWHKQCFHCTDCKQGFQGSFLVKDNKPYCEDHYPRENVTASPKPIPSKPKVSKPVASVTPTKPTKPAVPPKPTLPKPSRTLSRSLKPAKECHVCQSVIDGPCANALGHDYHIHHFQCHQCHRSLSSRVPGMWQGNSEGELVCKMCV
ncbi:hypothetical protein G6F56_006141 [Rhizopus delemar]|nr:hypothetical protein G6F56_006141 [Rhizopus delemar]